MHAVHLPEEFMNIKENATLNHANALILDGMMTADDVTICRGAQ